MMDHSELIEELPVLVERYSAAERIQLAKERRAIQLAKHEERERTHPCTRVRVPLLKFRSEIAILDATSRNDIEEVRSLLTGGADPNSHNEDGLTPLHQSSIDNNEQMMLLLLNFGADVNARDTEMWTPLHAAACCAHKAIVQLLIARGADLLAVNGDGNMPYDLCDDDETIELIEGEMASRGITQQMIDDKRGSAERDMLNDMKQLHQSGCKLDEPNPDTGHTHLHVAAAHGYYDVAAFLLRCGASTSTRDFDSWMPIHAASCWNQPDIIEILAEYGADINAKTSHGETPMDLCRDEFTRAVIATLIAEAARRKRVAFGARDSRRQSRKKRAVSKFESPDIPNSDNPFSARGAIRRLSFRDKAGEPIGRLEARRESLDLSKTFDALKLPESAKLDATSPTEVDVSFTKAGRKSSLKRRKGTSQYQTQRMSQLQGAGLSAGSGSVDLDDEPAAPGGMASPTTEDTPINGDVNKSAERPSKLDCGKCCTIS